MATGIPKKDRSASNLGVNLVYEGKKSEDEVLNGEVVQYKTVYSRSSDKRLYFGDSLEVLRLLASEPEICGNVNLIYISFYG